MKIYFLALLMCTNLFAQTLKTKDLSNQTISAQPTTDPNATLTPEQMEEFKKQSEIIKQKQIESQKALEELDKE